MSQTENLKNKRVVVTGGSRGLGRAIVVALLARGAAVTAVARDKDALAEVATLGASTRAGDVTDPALIEAVIRELQPSILILNAGAAPHMGPIDEQTWESFSTNWDTDVKSGLYGVQAALKAPLAPGSRVLIASSGAAKVGAPLSGSYVGAKWMLWTMAHSANAIAKQRDLGIHFQVLAPMQLIGETALGQRVAEAYARRQASSVQAHIAARYGQTSLTPTHYGEQVAEMLSDDRFATQVAYGFHSEAGISALEDGIRR